MKVAKIINNKIEIYNIYDLYPDVSFPDVGVPDSFLTENTLYKVIDSVYNDPISQYVTNLDDPILKDGIVYTVQLNDRTPENILNYKWGEVRKTRDRMLIESDKHVLLDLWETYSDDLKIKIKQYRQNLRDLPQNFSDPDMISWPVNPFVKRL